VRFIPRRAGAVGQQLAGEVAEGVLYILEVYILAPCVQFVAPLPRLSAEAEG
jgi:hypothetical protein